MSSIETKMKKIEKQKSIFLELTKFSLQQSDYMSLLSVLHGSEYVGPHNEKST